MGILEEIGALLVANSLGTLGSDLFLVRTPPVPDACTTIYETGGKAPDYTHDQAAPRYENPTIKVIVRSDKEKNYKAAKDKARQIWLVLGAIRNQNLSGTRYLSIVPIQSPFSLGPDENNRLLISANYELEKEPS